MTRGGRRWRSGGDEGQVVANRDASSLSSIGRKRRERKIGGKRSNNERTNLANDVKLPALKRRCGHRMGTMLNDRAPVRETWES